MPERDCYLETVKNMSYQVIARRWRPQSFSEVVSQEHVSQTLRNSIKNGRISHAYLFTGPRGVGKTTMARILAKSLNCEHGPTDNPCGKCENCIEIKEGTSFDVIEIDGASNNGVDDIRELRENVNFAPLKGRYKVYIIDEVHMLSISAFNALLKTLEEPPEKVVFIFATTEIHKVPQTIMSRCQKYFFQKIGIDAIVKHLQQIVAREGYTIDQKALFAIARAADGAMRDAQSLLDQVIAFTGGSITEDAALSILGVVPLESYIRIMDNIADNNAQLILGEVARVVKAGADIPRFSDGLIELVRALRLFRNKVDLKALLGYATEEMERLEECAKRFNDEELSSFFRVLAQLKNDLRTSGNEQAALEMALLDMLAVKQRPSLAGILKAVSSGGLLEGSNSSSQKKNLAGDISLKSESLLERLGNQPPSSAVYNDAPVQKPVVVPSVVKQNDTAVSVKKDYPSLNELPPAGESLPPGAVMMKNPELSDYAVKNPLVEKIKECFHGEVIEQKVEGDSNAERNG